MQTSSQVSPESLTTPPAQSQDLSIFELLDSQTDALKLTISRLGEEWKKMETKIGNLEGKGLGTGLARSRAATPRGKGYPLVSRDEQGERGH